MEKFTHCIFCKSQLLNGDTNHSNGVHRSDFCNKHPNIGMQYNRYSEFIANNYHKIYEAVLCIGYSSGFHIEWKDNIKAVITARSVGKSENTIAVVNYQIDILNTKTLDQLLDDIKLLILFN